jgi:hypothetical protein
MFVHSRQPRIPLPIGWTTSVKSAAIHAIAFAQYAVVYTRSWAANSVNARVRLKAENGRLQGQVALLREELRVKDARMAKIEPHQKQLPSTFGRGAAGEGVRRKTLKDRPQVHRLRPGRPV